MFFVARLIFGNICSMESVETYEDLETVKIDVRFKKNHDMSQETVKRIYLIDCKCH